jgi:sugar O-acyltransferase (sialic acid O-acetyltransferase NeuD family)
MNDIFIYGAGGFGREIACLLNVINKVQPTWNWIGFLDDGIAPGTGNEYGKVLGGLDILNAWPKKVAVAIAIASPGIVEKLVNQIVNHHVYFPNIIAPNVLFFDKNNVIMGQGNILTFGCRLSCNVTLGNFNLLNGQVSLGHDVKLGNFNMLQPEVRISGETTVCDSNFFGVRSLVLQGIKIGNHTRIGTSSVVMRNTKDGMTYFGNPAKMISED